MVSCLPDMSTVQLEILAHGNGLSPLKAGDIASFFIVGRLKHASRRKPRFLRGEWLFQKIHHQKRSFLGKTRTFYTKYISTEPSTTEKALIGMSVGGRAKLSM